MEKHKENFKEKIVLKKRSYYPTSNERELKKKIVERDNGNF